jgi:hypothetical protein
MIYAIITFIFAIKLLLYYFQSQTTYVENNIQAIPIFENNLNDYYNTLTTSTMKKKTKYYKDLSNFQNFAMNVLPFTVHDKKQIDNLVLRIENVYLYPYSTFSKYLEWNFICMDDSVEEGMPHTIDKYIILPNHKVMSIQSTSISDTVLFIHEQLHIFQRLFQNKCNSFYVDYMGFIKPNSIQFDKITLKLNYPNPDGLDINWCYPLSNGTIICPLFIRKQNQFHKVGIEVVDLGNGNYKTLLKKNYPIMTNLVDIPEYKHKFNTPSNYHPNEITADLVSEYMVRNISVPPYIMQFMKQLLE